MTILMAHTCYQQPGGEEQVFAAEAALLEAHARRVVRHTLHNDRAGTMSVPALAVATLWNRAAARDLRRACRETGATIAHFHNTFPLMSPAVWYAARAEGAAIVQTIHNYRLLCPSATLYRDGAVCEDCLGKRVAWPGVAHGCYRGSRAATAVVAALLGTHRALGTWRDLPDVYIALTHFARAKLIEGGLPAERIVVKPNFVAPDPGPGDGSGGYVLFAGRLSAEKGIVPLLEAWTRFDPGVPLRIVGDGPLAATVAAAAEHHPVIQWLGRRPHAEVGVLMGGAVAVIVPSLWYESCPMVVLEAFAKGTPVIASNLGALAELVDHGRTGRLFRPGAAADLAVQVAKLCAEAPALRAAARAEFEAKYTAGRNYALLSAIYDRARGSEPAFMGASRPTTSG